MSKLQRYSLGNVPSEVMEPDDNGHWCIASQAAARIRELEEANAKLKAENEAHSEARKYIQVIWHSREDFIEKWDAALDAARRTSES